MKNLKDAKSQLKWLLRRNNIQATVYDNWPKKESTTPDRPHHAAPQSTNSAKN